MRALLFLLLVPGAPAFVPGHVTVNREWTIRMASSASGHAEYPDYVPSAVSDIEEPVGVKA